MLTPQIEELERRAKAAPKDFGGPDQTTWDYIEYANPARILWLIAHIRELEAGEAEARKAMEYAVDSSYQNHLICAWLAAHPAPKETPDE